MFGLSYQHLTTITFKPNFSKARTTSLAESSECRSCVKQSPILMRRLSKVTWPSSRDDAQGLTAQTTFIINTLRRKLRERKRSFRRSIFNEANQNVHLERLSASERIAFLYRNSASGEDTRPSNLSQSLHTSPTPAEIDNDSCLPRCNDVFPTGESCGLQKTQERRRFPDMLCGALPVIIENATEEFDNQGTLASYRCEQGNIIIESECLELAPHIVITLPPEQDLLPAPHIAQDNRVPYQSRPCLTVPPFYMSTCRMHTYAEWCALFYSPQPSFQEEQIYERTPGAQLVFSHALFQQWIQKTETERHSHFLRLVTPSVTRHLFKAASIAASLTAPLFRERYIIPGFFESIEQPFRWTDPAEALLLLYRSHPIGVHHIPSPRPCSVPHILIELSFPNDHGLLEANATPVQDCNDGANLVVLSSRRTTVSYVNTPQYIEDEDYPSFCSDMSSSCESIRPKTPTGLQRCSSGFFSSEVDEAECVSANPEWMSPVAKQLDQQWQSNPLEDNDIKAKFYIDEDEDDGLPEIDDWYQAIAQRTGLF